MKAFFTVIFLFLFCICSFAQEQVAFTPPPSSDEAVKMQERADIPTSEILKREGYLEHKNFAVNRLTDYTMYVEFLSKKGNRYTIPVVFASWQLSDDGSEGFIEVFKDSPMEGYPTLYFTLAAQPYFYKQIKVKE